ncbi:unnamed protein product [Cyclocybe aegerita]|uniref:NadR/Ttd14 AAA domain-containing protein n=1 Tax=Cyclocybe aegerita TaxID=1973307 RepID=A0A8S0VSM8_CYCAE|nr:unnamed protein product [Cyclocybe aegerita]
MATCGNLLNTSKVAYHLPSDILSAKSDTMSTKLPPPRSIYVIGPSSTGKTTLCDGLVKKLGIPQSWYITEVARTVMTEQGYSKNTIALVEMQKAIMEAHYAREKILDAAHCPLRVCDRSAIDPIVYAILTSRNDEEARERQAFLTGTEKFQKALTRYKATHSVVILLTSVPEWLVDDGVRTTENQEECVGIFKKLLEDLNVQYFEIGKEMKFLEERVMRAVGLEFC